MPGTGQDEHFQTWLMGYMVVITDPMGKLAIIIKIFKNGHAFWPETNSCFLTWDKFYRSKIAKEIIKDRSNNLTIRKVFPVLL